MAKLPITASVVCYNEGHLLSNCLEALSFCKEIIVIDLGSSDDSVEVAKRYTKAIYYQERNPIVEVYKIWVQDLAKFPWILFVDPDEIIDVTLKDDIVDLFMNKRDLLVDKGIVALPWQFYFKKKALQGTWGHINKYKFVLIHKERTTTKPIVHYGTKCLPEYSIFFIPRKSKNLLHHFWMSSYKSLFAKHKAYLQKEGEALFYNGERASRKQIALAPYTFFKEALLRHRGYQDGMVGIFLSLFWAWYNTMALWQLWKYQKKVKR